MTDRELLESAALASGVQIDDWNGDWPVVYREHWSGDPRDEPQREASYWNPLADDGDALRLAVNLGMHIVTALGVVGARWRSGDKDDWEYEEAAQDPQVATRRAIVRAAARIVTQMRKTRENGLPPFER